MNYIKRFYNNTANSYKIFVGNPLYLLSSFLVDLLFFFLFGIVYSFFSTVIIENLLEVNNLIAQLNSELSAIDIGVEDPALLSSLMAKEQLMAGYVKDIAVYGAALILCVYLLWCIFQAVNWHNASCIGQRKRAGFPAYLGKFSLLNLAWLFGAALIGYITYKLSVYNTLLRISLVSQNAINYFMLFLFALLFYFALVSYSFAGKETFFRALKNAFIYGIKKIHVYGALFLFSIALLFVVYYLVSLLSLGFVSTVIADLVLMLPVFAYQRLLFLAVSDNVK